MLWEITSVMLVAVEHRADVFSGDAPSTAKGFAFKILCVNNNERRFSLQHHVVS
jgi:hypothetical protein